MIRLENVGKEFDTGFSLKDLNLSIEMGEKVSIFGPNGAGKTTFLKILSGLVTPSSGSLTIGGYAFTKRVEILKNLGLVPQQGHFYEALSVRQNLEFYGKLYGLQKQELTKTMTWLLTEFNLLTKLDVKISQLSKGMKQRLLITKALLHDPHLLLLDEPYSGLDLQSSEFLFDFISSMKDKTVITATHDFDTGLREGQRIIIFNKGSIVFDGQWIETIPAFKEFYRKMVG
ncbi:ABC transporter ATP-binding protein [Desulfosporosinus youngiae]|uniref:ABC-type multidrug transport system, ATPase component n=1 Tax=Desulfosporosinus youngiae DSM 17734 TaxID=768710 RepID=H5XVZ2_9FIRM|nr:ATP-binding cassette domain-containing protein [Desulfosporosinus youngiae]EHQ90444.1 ABC-type multidrug transport system, ATPase component [Desulfosporosinus youngiae DSM 17734]